MKNIFSAKTFTVVFAVIITLITLFVVFNVSTNTDSGFFAEAEACCGDGGDGGGGGNGGGGGGEALIGCPDPAALNYTPGADGGEACIYPPVVGCTDPAANNTTPGATVDNGSCTYTVPGCTDPAAENTTPGANVDDGSCTYPPKTCDVTANASVIEHNSSITLTWNTQGFDTITINGEAVSGATGSRTYDNLTQNTTYTLRATNANGDECIASASIEVTQPPVEECKLLVRKNVNKATAAVGEELTYTVSVKNIGKADCTGGGVKIYDVVDDNVTYLRHEISKNTSAGYGSYGVYTAADRTLRFNGNILTPGEVSVIRWVGTVNKPAQCGDFTVYNTAKATALELDNFKTWVSSQKVQTTIDNDCETPKDKFITVQATKIVCTDESQLPNYGALGTAAPKITAKTATDWVATHSSCSLQSGWEFEWTANKSQNPSGTLIGSAGNQWTSFGPTNANGKTTTKINLTKDLTSDRLIFREVLQSGYIPFTYQTNGNTNVDAVSAEFYCYTDGNNYNNREQIVNPKDGAKYYCVAWNSPVKPDVKVPTCDSFTASPKTITVGQKATLTWASTHATEAFINNAVGSVPVDGSVEVSPVADTDYILTLVGVDNKKVTCQAPVKVSNDPVPVCKSFTASPSNLTAGGGNVTLTWNTERADTVTISPIVGVVAKNDSTSVAITQSTNFELIAKDNDGDEVSCTAPVTVADPAPFTCAQNVTFTASDTSIKRGQDVVLSWSTTNVDTVSISPINATALSGSQTVSPRSDIMYKLVATNGNKSISCPLSIDVSSGGGGGGGSATPRCDLNISDKKITLGEEIKLTWDTSNANSVTLKDDNGKVLFTTDDYLGNDKRDYYDGSIKLKPTKDTEFILTAERGSKDRDCKVEVEIEDNVVVLQTRDQQPLVAGISLTQVPYTGFEAGAFMTFMFYALLLAWALYITYLMVIRRQLATATVEETIAAPATGISQANQEAMQKAETSRPDVFATVTTPVMTSSVAPSNLPTAPVAAGYTPEEVNTNPHQVNNDVVTELENRAHEQKALLSSDAVRHFIATTEGEVERNEALDTVIAKAKNLYPLEDGWVVINEARMHSLCEVCQTNMAEAEASTEAFVPATVPEGTGSLAEAIVTGNIVAAYEMIGSRPMFALADAASDLDAVYRNRQGAEEEVSNLLTTEANKLSVEQIKNMITALTSALDGTYTDEASAVKMAIMKAVKEVA